MKIFGTVRERESSIVENGLLRKFSCGFVHRPMMKRCASGCTCVGLLLCLLLVGQSQQVFARSYVCDYSTFVLPLDGQIVPWNTKIWIGYSQELVLGVERFAVAIRRPSGEIDTNLDFSYINTEEMFVVIVSPRTVLDPNSHYEVLAGTRTESWAKVLAFDTSDELDSEPPEVPEVTVADVVNSGCTSGATLDIETDGDLVVLNHTGTTLNPATLSGDVSILQPEHELWFGDSADPCSPATWEYAKPRARTDVRAGAFDLAGNFSGWSSPEELGLYGCRFERKGTMVGSVAMLLLLFGIGRRRK